MINYLGKAGALALFSDGVRAVIIDTNLNLVYDTSDYDSLALSKSWTLASDEPVPTHVLELASASLTSLDTALTAGGDRMYTIPSGVQSEAKKALEWRKEHKRGGTPVGLNTARTLAKGGQIGIKKIRHIAKYFPRHSIHKGSDGWKPGDDKFPSNGRIAWALWGGDAARRWASAIVERENKKSVTAGGYTLPGYEDHLDTYIYEDSYDADIGAFKMAHELDPYLGPEFMARIRLDNSGIDRLYKVEVDGQVYLWDGSGWDNMGHVDGDVYSYDKALDELGDTVEKTHVIIDPSSAIIISAFLQERPFQPVTLDEIDPQETALMFDGLAEEDFTMIDRVVTAAGEMPVAKKSDGSATDKDGNYTEEERSQIAASQPRDATGRFVKVGSRTVVGGDKERGSGKIESIDFQTGKVNVLLDNGKKISVDSKQTQPENTVKDVAPRQKLNPPSRLPLDGILGKHNPSQTPPKATLPDNVNLMGNDGLKQLLDNWSSTVEDERNAKAAKSATPAPAEKTDSEKNYTVEKGGDK